MERVSAPKPKIVTEISAHGLFFSEMIYPAKYWMPAHQHQHSQFVLVLGGAVEHQVGQAHHCLTAQIGGYIPHHERHSDLFLGSTRVFDVCLMENSHRGLAGDFGPQTFHRHHSATKLLASVYQEFKNPDRYTPSVLEALTLELLVSLHRHPNEETGSGNPQWLDRARDLLHEELSETLRIENIALEVGVHPAHLTKAFRRRFGLSIGEYVRQLRIARARHMIEVTEMPMGEIAFATGFSDQAHFTRTFKKYTGTTPNSYRGAQFKA